MKKFKLGYFSPKTKLFTMCANIFGEQVQIDDFYTCPSMQRRQSTACSRQTPKHTFTCEKSLRAVDIL